MAEPERHEALIRQLSSGLAPVRRLPSPWLRSLLWLAICAALAAGLAGFDGLQTVSRKLEAGPMDVAELIGAALTGASAAFVAFLLAVPGRPAAWALLPVPFLLLWLGASGWGCWQTEAAGYDPAAQASPQTCFNFLVGVSVPLSILLLAMLRRTYSVRPSLTATMAGLASAGMAAALLNFAHPVDITASDLAVHVGAVALIIAANRLMSGRALRRWALVLAVAVAVPVQGLRAEAARPLVLELFTSQGCSSCPPADALLSEYARGRPDLLPLAFHVEYWNRLGWADPFSSAAYTARQRLHASRLGDPQIYTPEMIIDGQQAVIGSDRGDVEAAIRAAKSRALTLAAVGLRRSGPGEITITVGPGAGNAAVLLVGFDPSHTTSVGRGENGGRTLLESNIVRSFEMVGQWNGTPLELHRPAPAGERLAVLLEAADGRVGGAAVIPSARR